MTAMITMMMINPGAAQVRIISFTGSTAVGQKIAALTAPAMKKVFTLMKTMTAMSSFKELKPSHGYFQVSLELGGKNAAVVFDDADVEAAVAGVTRFFIGTFFLGIVKSSW